MKKRRLAIGKTQQQLATAIGKSKSYVKQIEAGVILLHNKRNIVDKLIKNLSGWSRHEAYNMLGIEYKRLTETMTLDKAKEEFTLALVDTRNVNQFILQVLSIRTKFEMDFRRGTPGEFLHSHEVAEILSKIKDITPTETAKAFVKIGIKAGLTQKQWERVFRACKKDLGKSSLEPLEKALTTVMWDEETDQITKNSKQETEGVKSFEDQFKNIEMITKEVSAAGIKNLKKEAFFILKEFFVDLLTDDERETFMKLMSSIESH